MSVQLPPPPPLSFEVEDESLECLESLCPPACECAECQWSGSPAAHVARGRESGDEDELIEALLLDAGAGAVHCGVCPNDGCGAQIVMEAMSIHVHLHCPMLPVACQDCEEVLPRCQLPLHAAEACAYAACPVPACLETPLRSELEAHMQQNAQQHVVALSDCLQDVQQQLRELRVDVAAQRQPPFAVVVAGSDVAGVDGEYSWVPGPPAAFLNAGGFLLKFVAAADASGGQWFLRPVALRQQPAAFRSGHRAGDTGAKPPTCGWLLEAGAPKGAKVPEVSVVGYY